MSPFVIFPYYLAWHYTRALRDFFTIWGNLLWFVYQFFSIKLLLKTLFSPFKRLKEQNTGGILDFEGLFESLVINTIMRVVGFLFRSIVIVMGIISYFLAIMAGIIVFILWIALPFLIAFLLIASAIGFFKTT